MLLLLRVGTACRLVHLCTTQNRWFWCATLLLLLFWRLQMMTTAVMVLQHSQGRRSI
jgi:hypothetical protein